VKLFPDSKRAPFMLTKKLWIQINRLTQTLSVSVGDLVENEDNVLFSYSFGLGKQKEGWDHEVDLFSMPNYSQNVQIGL
jgi:hypothetical protein